MKKAITPLLTTVLLIGMLFTIAIIVFTFQRDFITRIQYSQNNLEKICLSNVRAEILSSCYNQENQISVTVQNQGNFIITQNSIFRIKGQDTCILIAPPFSEILPYQTNSFNFDSNCNNMETIEFIPSIELNGENEFCDISSASSELELC